MGTEHSDINVGMTTVYLNVNMSTGVTAGVIPQQDGLKYKLFLV